MSSYKYKVENRGVGGQKSQKLVNIVCERSLVTFVKDSKDKGDSYALF